MGKLEKAGVSTTQISGPHNTPQHPEGEVSRVPVPPLKKVGNEQDASPGLGRALVQGYRRPAPTIFLGPGQYLTTPTFPIRVVILNYETLFLDFGVLRGYLRILRSLGKVSLFDGIR